MNLLRILYWFLRFQILLVSLTIFYFGRAFFELLSISTPDSALNLIQRTARIWGAAILKYSGIELEVIGDREILSREPASVVINHPSLLDFFVWCILAPPNTPALAKKSLRYLPIIGWFMKKAGIIFIDRFHRERAMKSMEEAKTLILENKRSLLIAAEGTRTYTGELQPLKKGAFYLALQTKLPMIPVTIVGAYALFPRHVWYPKPGKILVYIDPPMDTHTWTEKSLPQAMDEVTHIFQSHLKTSVLHSGVS